MNFVCIFFELGDKMLTLTSMENLIVQCNRQIQTQRYTIENNTYTVKQTRMCLLIRNKALPYKQTHIKIYFLLDLGLHVE